MFSSEGHLDLPQPELLRMARSEPRRLVTDFLMVGTPRVFDTYVSFCRFREALASKLQLHPCAIVVRGSARLGYSIAPRVGKAWCALRDRSDIDVAIADVDYFNRLDNEIRDWEARQRIPHYRAPEYEPYAKRQQYRTFNCVSDDWLPPNTCVPHKDVMDAFDTAPFCGLKRSVTAFIFRDWWSLRNRCEFDLRALCEAIDKGTVLPPVDSTGS